MALTTPLVCSIPVFRYPCDPGQYIATPASAISGNYCSPLTSCTQNITYETAAPTATSDRVCTNTTQCVPPITAMFRPATLTSNFGCCAVQSCDEPGVAPVPGASDLRPMCCLASTLNTSAAPLPQGGGRTDGGTAAGGGVRGSPDEDVRQLRTWFWTGGCVCCRNPFTSSLGARVICRPNASGAT